MNELSLACENDDDPNVQLNAKLRREFDGRIVRKDLTKKIKEGANVPVYVLEYLLGQYCGSDDPEFVADGVATVKRILAENYVRPDEAKRFFPNCVDEERIPLSIKLR